MRLDILALLGSILAYFAIIAVSLNRWEQQKRLNVIIQEGRKDARRVFFFERALLDRLHIEPEKVHTALMVERVLLFIAIFVLFMTIKGITILFVGAVFITLFFNDAYKVVIYESGIENVPRVVNFINFFIPHINSGNSADQSLLAYIQYSRDDELAEFYEHKGDIEYKLQPHLKQIVDIYDVAKYNEEKGISDYTYILNEIAQDYSQKQVYYNSFISRIGEIKPIVMSYYIAVPFLIILSMQQTYDFWMGIGGVIVAIVTLILFAIFKALIFRLQKQTVKDIF